MGRPRGFSLIEAAVAVAVMSILAGMMAPMALRIMNQRRAAATRKNLKAAFEAMFGSRERRVANMRADFGFNPGKSLKGLSVLVGNSMKVPAFGRNGADFPWGYNGPYWLGPVVGGHPADAWGNPIDLICTSSKGVVTWQVHSPGPDRLAGEDDLYYPSQPASESGFRGTVLVVVTRESPDLFGKVVFRCLDNGSLTSNEQTLDPKQATQSFSFSGPAGGMEVAFIPSSKGFKELTIPMDLLPGRTREVDVKL